jgi:hypothetical protein
MSEDYDVFLSHSLKDRDWASDLVRALMQRRLRVWSNFEGIRVGDSWYQAIDDGIRKSRSFVAIITPESVRSSFMAAELGSALALKKPLIPVVSEDTPSEELPGPIRLRRYITLDEPETVAEEISRRLAPKTQKNALGKDDDCLAVTN